MPGICGRKKGTGKAEKTMGGRREGMDEDDDGGLCEEREEQGAMEEGDVVDSGLRSAAMRMVTTTTTTGTRESSGFDHQLRYCLVRFRTAVIIFDFYGVGLHRLENERERTDKLKKTENHLSLILKGIILANYIRFLTGLTN